MNICGSSGFDSIIISTLRTVPMFSEHSSSFLHGRRENIFLLLENDLPPCLSYSQESKGISAASSISVLHISFFKIQHSLLLEGS